MPHTSNTDTLKLTYFSYFHTVVKYEMCLGRGGGGGKIIKQQQ